MGSNIYTKLQQMRVDLQNLKLKKSGENKFAGYKYYELGDILPHINQLMNAQKVTAIVSFGSEQATLRLVNAENPDEVIEFASPMAGANLKGAHDIQNLGAVETYQRRYLYMTAFEVVESDFFDATQGMPKKRQYRKADKLMSEEMSAKLNDAIKNYAGLTGLKNKEIAAKIAKETGKAPANMTDEDGEAVLKLIHNWSDQYINEIGA